MSFADSLEALRLQNQASSSHLPQLLECRRMLDLSRARCQLLERALRSEELAPEEQSHLLQLLDEERYSLEVLSYDYLILLEEERQWSLMYVQCFDEMVFPEGGLWRSFFTEELAEEDRIFRQHLMERRALSDSIRNEMVGTEEEGQAPPAELVEQEEQR
jgi:hypothetical protein